MKAKIPKIKPDTEINRMGKKEKATKAIYRKSFQQTC